MPSSPLQLHYLTDAPANLDSLDSLDSFVEVPALMFGHLNQDMPREVRQQSIAHWQQALNALIEEADWSADTLLALNSIKARQAALALARAQCQSAAEALLDQPLPWDSVVAGDEHFEALLTARLAGIRSEAQLQRDVGHLSAHDYARLENLLGGGVPEPTDCVAEIQCVDRGRQVALDGPWLMTSRDALEHPDQPHAVQLYWPGNEGGLATFPSLQALRQALLGHWVQADTGPMALNFRLIEAPVLAYSLEQQLNALYFQAQQLEAGTSPYPDTPDLDAARQRWREEALHSLSVPGHAARDQALEHVAEQHRSAKLAGHLPRWFDQLSSLAQADFKRHAEGFVTAMNQSQRLLDQDCPRRDDFVWARVSAKLEQDLGLPIGYRVNLVLPVSVDFTRSVDGGPGAPVAYKIVATASREQVVLSLADLALQGIDQTMAQRLTFMSLECLPASASWLQRLERDMTVDYLKTFVTELDVAQAYQEHLVQVFKGFAEETAAEVEHRGQQLLAPFRASLWLQHTVARYQRARLSSDALALFAAAIDGQGDAPLLYSAVLRPGQALNGESQAVILSGVVFIRHRRSSLTLLYLPDVPGGRCLREFVDLAGAEQFFFDSLSQRGMPQYLAQRPTVGDAAAHEAFINQAWRTNLQGFIICGPALTLTSSLAKHLLNEHLDRLIALHRSSSRSQSDLYLEASALNAGNVFNYVKMALGMLPFVGAVIALHDAWDSANQAVAAVLRGDGRDAAAHVESVLLSLIDAAMDVLPGGSLAVPSTSVPARISRARGASRLRQTSRLPVVVRSANDPFQGYASTVSLAGHRPSQGGRFNQVYQLAQGNFLMRDGLGYRIEWDDAYRTWRLSGTYLKTYKQPVMLSEAGRWETPGTLYGVLVENGLAGGGGAMGRLVDGAAAASGYLPLAIQNRLPRWWTDAAYRQQGRLRSALQHHMHAVDDLMSRVGDAYQQVVSKEGLDYERAYTAIEPLIRSEIDSNVAMLETLETAHLAFPLRDVRHWKAQRTYIVAYRYLLLIGSSSVRLRRWLVQEQAYSALMQGLYDQLRLGRIDVGSAIQTHKQQLEVFITAIKGLLDESDALLALGATFRQWNEKVPAGEFRVKLNKAIADRQYHFNQPMAYRERFGLLLDLIIKRDPSDPDFRYLHHQYVPLRQQLDRSINTQLALEGTYVPREQRLQMYRQFVDRYLMFKVQCQEWVLGYPNLFDKVYTGRMLKGLDHYLKLAREALERLEANPGKQEPSGQRSGQRVFEVQNEFLLGDPGRDAHGRRVMRISSAKRDTQMFVQDAEGRWVAKHAPASFPEVPEDLPSLIRQATEHLAMVKQLPLRAQGYAHWGMQPASLEDYLAQAASALLKRAQTIEASPAAHARKAQVAAALRVSAGELRLQGQRLRMEQVLKTERPTVHDLDYLLAQNRVQIVRSGALETVLDGRGRVVDHLLEYQVRDQSTGEGIWYVHFHYPQAAPVFEGFAQAHIKTRAQRRLGLQWQIRQQALGAAHERIWRGVIKRDDAERLFAPLFKLD